MTQEIDQLKAKLEVYEKLHTSASQVSNLNPGFSAAQGADDEIDLRELWNVIWAGRIKIIGITALFAIASVIFALSKPNIYKSEMILAPAQSESGGGLSGLASQYGGLAAMAGINIGGGESSRIDQAVELMKSWDFLEKFINKYNLKPQIMAATGWNKATGKLIYDADVYNSEAKQWTKEIDEGEDPAPSSWQAYKALSGMLSVTNDDKSGMLTIAVEHYSPNVAYQWTNLLKQEINHFYQQQDMIEAQRNIDYLKAKIGETNVTEMKSVFYSMIESQTKTLMLAEVSEQYLVKTIVPAKIAEQKSKPKRALIVILASLLGGMFSVFLVLINKFFRNK